MSFAVLRDRVRRVFPNASRSRLRDFVDRFRGAPDGLPIPPARLHVLVSGNLRHGVAEYFEIGGWCIEKLESMLAADGVRLADFGSILDFGCGCARVLRRVRPLTEARLVGTDVNGEAIAWCRAELPIAEFEVNAPAPPLAFAPGSFDLVYAFSVFTHLPEDLQRPWIEELARVLRPGGYLLFTTLGAVYQRALPEAGRRKLDRDGSFVRYAPYPGGEQCLAYHTDSFVRGTLTAGLELRGFEAGTAIDAEGRLLGQDAYLVRKPAPDA
jgi:SAM-dependent methyltransferase